MQHKERAIVLIQGLPGAGKTTLARMLLDLMPTASWVNADFVRENINPDLTFSLVHRIEHARRMAEIANLTLNYGANDHCIVDFVCPTVETRRAFLDAAEYPVYTVFMNTITADESMFADTRKMYQAPTDYAFRVSGYKTIGELKQVARTIHLALLSRSPNFSMTNLRRSL
ncbi:adenylylsulfate kinase [Cupriavidus sp. UYMU48A]|nr:adenylylsulfate kinase [Cupriavidus sp. UYMU48A]